MKFRIFMAITLAVSPIALAPACADQAAPPAPPAPAAAPAPAFTTSDTDLGTLLDNAATKAVLMKYIPTMISNPQIDMARSMTLKQLQSYAADQLADDTLAKIDADFTRIAASK